jgi:hypothetical protein
LEPLTLLAIVIRMPVKKNEWTAAAPRQQTSVTEHKKKEDP